MTPADATAPAPAYACLAFLLAASSSAVDDEDSSATPRSEHRPDLEALSRILLSTAPKGTTHIPAKAYTGPTDIHFDACFTISIRPFLLQRFLDVSDQLVNGPAASSTEPLPQADRDLK